MSVTYGVQLFDDLHNYLPDIIYNPGRFRNVQELLEYIQIGIQRTSPFNRGLQEYNRRNTPQFRSGLQYSFSPLGTFDSYAGAPDIPIGPTNSPSQTYARVRTTTIPVSSADVPYITSLINELNNQDNTGNISNQFTNILTTQLLRSFLDQTVTVRPSEQQVNRATTTEVVSALIEDNCAICQDAMERGAHIRKINHCGHIFHKECIDAWFDRNVHCPTCRHDIREVPSSNSSQASQASHASHASQASQGSQRSQRSMPTQPRRVNTYERSADV